MNALGGGLHEKCGRYFPNPVWGPFLSFLVRRAVLASYRLGQCWIGPFS